MPVIGILHMLLQNLQADKKRHKLRYSTIRLILLVLLLKMVLMKELLVCLDGTGYGDDNNIWVVNIYSWQNLNLKEQAILKKILPWWNYYKNHTEWLFSIFIIYGKKAASTTTLIMTTAKTSHNFYMRVFHTIQI